MLFILEFVSTCWACMLQMPVQTILAKSSLHQVVHSKVDSKVKVECDGELLVEISAVLNLWYTLKVLRHLKYCWLTPCKLHKVLTKDWIERCGERKFVRWYSSRTSTAIATDGTRGEHGIRPWRTSAEVRVVLGSPWYILTFLFPVAIKIIH